MNSHLAICLHRPRLANPVEKRKATALAAVRRYGSGGWRSEWVVDCIIGTAEDRPDKVFGWDGVLVAA